MKQYAIGVEERGKSTSLPVTEVLKNLGRRKTLGGRKAHKQLLIVVEFLLPCWQRLQLDSSGEHLSHFLPFQDLLCPSVLPPTRDAHSRSIVKCLETYTRVLGVHRGWVRATT